MKSLAPYRSLFARAMSCVALPLCASCPRALTPIDRAVHFLATTQTAHDNTIPGYKDYAGNWPQVFYFQNVRGYRIPDVSPFVVAFTHHALTNVTANHQSQLNVSDTSVADAQMIRKRAVACLKRFEARPDAPDAHTFGFWPYDDDPRPRESPLERFLFQVLEGPVLGGSRAPLNLAYYPSQLNIPTDADVTSTTYAALLDDALFDAGSGSSVHFEKLFAAWRDTGAIPLRFAPDWLPNPSGAFLTWLAFLPDGYPNYGNDIDLVVDANVLYALARYDRKKTPGFDETVALINSAVARGLHRTRWDDISLYYPDSYVFHYCVSRAYREGGIPALAPSVKTLAAELLDEAIDTRDGSAHWDKGNPHLNTAFALLTLMNADADSPVIEAGIRYLESQQDPVTGAWDEAPFFLARTDGGEVIEWASAPLTTAFALEALCRYRLR